MTTQSFADSIEVEFKAAGYKFAESDGVGKYESDGEGDSAEATLGKDALVVLIFKK